MHLPGLHDRRRIGAAVKLVDLVAHRFAEVGITSLLSLIGQRGHVGFFAELDRDLPAGIFQEALSATAGNLLKVEPLLYPASSSGIPDRTLSSSEPSQNRITRLGCTGSRASARRKPHLQPAAR
jgi:hypothetical protein